MEHSHDIIKIEKLDDIFTKFYRRDDNTFILKNIPEEFFDSKKLSIDLDFIRRIGIFLNIMSNKIGEVVNEYMWIECCEFIKEIKDKYNIDIYQEENGM